MSLDISITTAATSPNEEPTQPIRFTASDRHSAQRDTVTKATAVKRDDDCDERQHSTESRSDDHHPSHRPSLSLSQLDEERRLEPTMIKRLFSHDAQNSQNCKTKKRMKRQPDQTGQHSSASNQQKEIIVTKIHRRYGGKRKRGERIEVSHRTIKRITLETQHRQQTIGKRRR